MHLSADVVEESKDDHLPKYVPVERFSAFSQEKEFLFHGERCKLQIRNIYEGHVAKSTSHRTELSALNVFQKMLENEKIEWKCFQNELLMIQEYIRLTIAKFVNAFPLSTSVVIDAFYFVSCCFSGALRRQLLSSFGLKLFEFFCGNEKRKEIQVRLNHDFDGPLNDMFFDDDGRISLLRISGVLPKVSNVALTALSEIDLLERCGRHIESLMNLDSATSSNIQIVEFRSVFYQKTQANIKIEEFVQKKTKSLFAVGWFIDYDCFDGHFHRITTTRMNNDQGGKSEKVSISTPINTRSNHDDTAEAADLNLRELILDADSEIMQSLSEENQSEFGMAAVRAFWKQKDMDLMANAIAVKVRDVQKGSIRILYELIPLEINGCNAKEITFERDNEAVETVMVDSMVFPVKKHEENVELSLAKHTMIDEIEAHTKLQDVAQVITVEKASWPEWTRSYGERLVAKIQMLLTNGAPVWEERELVIIRQFCSLHSSKYVIHSEE